MAFKTVYVTGAPASGKSSTLRMLRAAMPGLDVWEYGARLTSMLQERDAELKDQDEIRSRSAQIVRPEDIEELDDQLIAWVETNRATSHLLIDSHPVTKEVYGFRVTAFSGERFRALAPSEIWCFYTAPEVAVERIRSDPSGRPLISVEEARMHTFMQASVAANYGVIAGCPVYLFDTDTVQEQLVERLGARLH